MHDSLATALDAPTSKRPLTANLASCPWTRTLRLAAQLGDSYPFRKLDPETDSSGEPARGAPADARDGSARSGRWGASQGIALTTQRRII